MKLIKWSVLVIVGILQMNLVACQFNDLLLGMIEATGGIFFNQNERIRDVHDFLPFYDFIVVGSGSGGSVVVNRLTENRNWTVLLLEAGGEEPFVSEIPITASLVSSTNSNWNYKTERQANACLGMKNGVCTWPKGKVLGGTSVLNFMIHTKGHKRDYDNWSYLGNTGWSYEEVLPYFMKTENVHVPSLRNQKYRGKSGYLDVDYPKYMSPLLNSFAQAGRDLGYPYRDPNNDLSEMLGFSRVQANTRKGRRASASKTYIRSILKRNNLDISLNSRVVRVVIDSKTKTAIGVEFIKNQKRYFVRAKREVILSAGSIASPQILMLSGIGPREHLEKFNIPVHSNLKVGYNLHDHQTFSGITFLVNQSVTITERELGNPRNGLNYMLNHEGPFTLPSGVEGVSFIKTNHSELPDDYPDIEIILGLGSFASDSAGFLRNVFGFPDDYFEKVYARFRGRQSFALGPILMRPKSRGRLTLRSLDPFHQPRLDPGYFTDPHDFVILKEGIRMAVKIGESRAFRRFGSHLLPMHLPGCERFPLRSEAYLDCIIPRYASTINHQVGTCKMGVDEDAVVDPELRVYGIRNLRVVDGSIIPVIPAAHTNAVIYMIGEKASDMIKRTWIGR
jgi:choline dehydrogenase-like flavoprotein